MLLNIILFSYENYFDLIKLLFVIDILIQTLMLKYVLKKKEEGR